MGAKTRNKAAEDGRPRPVDDENLSQGGRIFFFVPNLQTL